MTRHLPPGLPGTISRTTISVTLTFVAFAGWLAILFSPLPWPAAVGGGTAVGLGMLYSMIRIGGMGRCLACKHVIPALWGGAYCHPCEPWVTAVSSGARDVTAELQLIGLHGPAAVEALVQQFGRATVIDVALRGTAALPESASDRDRRELREFLGYRPITAPAEGIPMVRRS